MENNKKKNKKKLVLLVILIGAFYLLFNVSYSSYESEADARVNADTSKWHIEINGNDVSDSPTQIITVDDVEWDSTHTRSGKIGPGSTGTAEFTLDCTGTEVSLDYEFYFKDSTVDPDLILTVTNVTSTTSLTNNGNNHYTGRLNLTDINNGVKPVITVSLEWVNDDSVNDLDKDIGADSSYLLVDFNATQYKG